MRGLALEGGGARGAYHIGVVKAYIEEGCSFDGFVGTSIGAINAAILAQGDYEKALEMWGNLSGEYLFDAEEQDLIKISKAKWDMSILSGARSSLKKIIESGGVDTSKIRAVVGEAIDEKKLRSAGKDFGLVTVATKERKAYELFIEDIPQGELIQYIMASACFPGFKSEIIDGKSYIDGGLYNNSPINMLLEKGYDEIIVVRTQAPGIFRHFSIPKGVHVNTITPSEDLGNVMLFSPETSVQNIKMGYFDGLRSLRNLRGQYYYLNPVHSDESLAQLTLLDDDTILEAGKILGISEIPPKRMLFEHIIPKIGRHLKLKMDFDYADFAIALMEYSAKLTKLERYQVYDYREFMYLVKDNFLKNTEKETSFLHEISSRRYKKAIQLVLQDFLQCNGSF